MERRSRYKKLVSYVYMPTVRGLSSIVHDDYGGIKHVVLPGKFFVLPARSAILSENGIPRLAALPGARDRMCSSKLAATHMARINIDVISIFSLIGKESSIFLGNRVFQVLWETIKGQCVSMTSWIFVFLMYFCSPSYFLTNKDISMKFWEMIENILVHIGLFHWSLYF